MKEAAEPGSRPEVLECLQTAPNSKLQLIALPRGTEGVREDHCGLGPLSGFLVRKYPRSQEKLQTSHHATDLGVGVGDANGQERDSGHGRGGYVCHIWQLVMLPLLALSH